MWCKECFEAGDHEGHNWQSQMAMGVCDCGDVDSIKAEGFCKKHVGISNLKLKQPNQIPIEDENNIKQIFISYFYNLFHFTETYLVANENILLAVKAEKTILAVFEIMTKLCLDNPYFSHIL